MLEKNDTATEETIIKTITDEFCFPCRLHYQVLNQTNTKKSLKSIKCIHYDSSQNRWCIHCEDEALEFGWSDKYIQELRKERPVVVGVIRFQTPHKLYIHLRCMERATPVLQLIDKYIPHSTMIGTHIDICNKLLVTRNPHNIPSPEEIFADESKIHYEEEFRIIDDLESQARITGKDFSREIDAVFKTFMKKSLLHISKEDMNDLQRKRLDNFYVDGPENFKRTMEMARTLALVRHQRGGKLNVFEFLQKLMNAGNQ